MATESIYQVYRYWLKAEDLRGLEHEVVISKAYLQTFFKKDEKGQRLSFQKVCLSFKDKPKDMYLDAEQADAVRKIMGTDKFAGWVGKTITLSAAGGRIQIWSKPVVKAAPKVAAPSVARNQLVEA